MSEIYKDLRQVGVELETKSVLETLVLMVDAQKFENLKAMDDAEMPGMDNFHEFGKRVELGQKFKGYKHMTPDSKYRENKIMFNDFDRERGVGSAFGTNTNPEEDEHDDT